ncbi:MAG TPA: hypothetical protein VLJ15_00190 [Gammaproteobacteria bacterium]|nr:hypothetical protein [Gammaproteobacteria bacterium]
MLLRQASLRALDGRLQAGKKQLLKKEKKVNDALRALHHVSDTLREMKKLDESSYTDSLSPAYIQSLRNDSDTQRILEEIDQVSLKVADSDIVHRLQEIEALIASLSDEEWVSKALLLDDLRKPVILYITDSLRPLATNPKKMDALTRRGLRFETIPLLDLIQYANEVMQETGSHEALQALLQKARVKKDEWLCGYFRYEHHLLRQKHHHLIVSPEKEAFIKNNLAPAETKGFSEQVGLVEKLMKSIKCQEDFSDKDELPDIGEEKLLSDIAILKHRAEHHHNILLSRANEQTAINKHSLDQKNLDLKKLEADVGLLVSETETLEQLLRRQKNILTRALQVPPGDIASYENNAQQLGKMNEEIQTQKQAVENAKKISADYSRFVDFFKEEKKDVNHRGTLYAAMKKTFSEKTDPDYRKAMEQADVFLLTNNENEQNKFNKLLKKARAEAEARQAELEKLTHLRAALSPLLTELGQAKLAYETHKKLYDEMKALRKEVFDAQNESKHDGSFPPDFDKKVEQGIKLRDELHKSRIAAAKLFVSIKKIEEQISEDIRKTENYKQYEKDFQPVWDSFLKDAIDKDKMEDIKLFDDVLDAIRKKNELRQAQFPQELLCLFRKVFNEEKMEAVWKNIGNFTLFEGLSRVIIGEKTIQVPNDIGDVYNALHSDKDPAGIIKFVCSQMKRRVKKETINKLMGCLYKAASDFVSEDGENLAITEEKLAAFDKIIDTTFQSVSPTATLILSTVKRLIG